MIQLSQITKVYGKGDGSFQALYPLDLEVKKGEFLAIMGPSGSGKSTLMNILGALDRPSSGNYFLDGENVAQMSDAQLASFRNRRIGFVFQRFNLLPRISVIENVALPGLYGNLPNLREKALAVLTAVGLESKVNSMPNAISGGQVQRVAIARALLMDPAIIMADEPTGNLDSKTASEVMKIFNDLNKKGNTIILVTHEEEVAKNAKRIVSIRDGKIFSDKSK